VALVGWKAEHGCENVMIDRTSVIVRFIARKKLASILGPLCAGGAAAENRLTRPPV
jgi:hypothetical protein